jgi:hypothetical protein
MVSLSFPDGTPIHDHEVKQFVAKNVRARWLPTKQAAGRIGMARWGRLRKIWISWPDNGSYTLGKARLVAGRFLPSTGTESRGNQP